MNLDPSLVALREVAARAGNAMGQRRDEFRSHLIPVAIFAYDARQGTAQLDYRILALCKDRFAFINERHWEIHIGILLQEGIVEPAADYLPTPLPGEFVNWPIEKVEAQILTEITSQIIAMIDADGGDGLDCVDARTVAQFYSADGCTLYISRDDADKICTKMGQQASNLMNRRLSKAGARRLYQGYVDSFAANEKPTRVERRSWANENGLTRDMVDDLHKELSPSHWSKGGRPSKTSQ